MPVLVDFAHGKPMFVIHTDHHDTQVGVGTDSKSFRQARSNVETISQVVSPSDIFPDFDIRMISTVDSADFVRMGVSPDDIMNMVFNLDKSKGLEKNKKAMALVTNKLLLAYKNKPNFLVSLVMDSTPSLLNIYQNILKMAKEEGYVSPEAMKANQETYIQSRKEESQKKDGKIKYYPESKITVQYGGGNLRQPGSYDRYVPFKLFPETDFLITVWPLGLMQASCNPFKEGRSLKGVNLGEIAKEVLLKFEDELKNYKIPLDTVKYFAEKNEKHFTDESIGFTWHDLIALYKEGGVIGLDKQPKEDVKIAMGKQYRELTKEEKTLLSKMSITGWDVIKANSGGHKCITNISGLMFFGKDAVSKGGKEILKRIGREFYYTLKSKIKEG
jgi:hypothetical protein